MIERIYLDSNVFVSLVREEIDGNFRMLYRDSEIALSICNSARIKVVVSYLFFDEIKKACGLDRKSASEILYKNVVYIEEVNKPQLAWLEEAFDTTKETGLHYTDSLHATIAKQCNCDFILTWNVKDFEKVGKIMRCMTPSEFIGQFV